MSNATHPYDFPASEANDFERKGHPGKFLKSITCAAGTTTYFTGSNYGLGGIVCDDSATGTAYFSNGGSIPLVTLQGSKRVLEFSLSSINVTGGNVYALIKNPLVK